MTTTASVSLLIDKDASEEQFTAFLGDLSRDHIDTTVVRRPPEGPFAALDWLIPTGIILFIAKPYFETILKKMAEDHYAILKSATGKLWKKFFGPKPEIERAVHGRGGVVKESPFSRSFSITAQSVHGTKITLLFPRDVTSEDFVLAIEKFELLMLQHHASGGADPLSSLLESRELPPMDWQQLIYLNPKSKRLELIDYVQSSRLSELISDEITHKQA
ncbi:MAG: hypothetical protein M3A44_15050 [Gammaproteobacteria bacterium]